MKKLTVILIIATITIMFLLSTGCEKQRLKNEIVEFDEAYWNLASEFEVENEKSINKLNNLQQNYQQYKQNDDVSVTINKLNSNIEGLKQAIEIKNDFLEYYLTYISDFRALKIPSPLDDFYYKKLETFNKNVEAIQTEIKFNSADLSWSELMRDGLKNKDYSNIDYVEEISNIGDELLKETERLYNEIGDLQIECDKIRREVYREYGLDDLLTKWQE
jgi:hypothetical protein